MRPISPASEVDMADYVLVIQVLMEATNGLGIVLENRYYGGSYPFNSSTTDELAYHTTEQSKRLKI